MTDSYDEIIAREIVTTRVLHAPVERAFRAFADPEALAMWWGPDGFTNTFHTFEFRVGGHWRFTMHGPDGHQYENEIEFTVIEEPHFLVMEHISAPLFRATIILETMGDGTKATFRQLFDTVHTFNARTGVAMPANEQIFDRLEAVLAR